MGIFLTLDASISLFVATLLFRVVFQSIGKYTLWILECDLIKTLAKKDGVYDEHEIKKKSPLIKSKTSKTLRKVARKDKGFIPPSAIDTHALDFKAHTAKGPIDLAKIDFKALGMGSINTGEPVLTSLLPTPPPILMPPSLVAANAKDQEDNLFEEFNKLNAVREGEEVHKEGQIARGTEQSTPIPRGDGGDNGNSPNTPKEQKGMDLFYSPSTPPEVGTSGSLASSLHSSTANTAKKTVGEMLLDSSVASRGIQGKLKGHEFDVTKLKTDYQDLRECKHLLIRCKESTNDGWTAYGRQELGCQVWIRDHHRELAPHFWDTAKSKDDRRPSFNGAPPKGAGIEVKCMSFIEGANCFEVFEYLKDHCERKIIAGQGQKRSNTNIVKRLSFNRAVYHQRFKLHAPFNDRELFFEQYCCRLPNGSFVIRQKSYEMDRKDVEGGVDIGPEGERNIEVNANSTPPPFLTPLSLVAGAVRINLMLGGYVVENYHEHGVTVTQYNHTDPDGGLPRAILRLYSPMTVRGVINLKAHFHHLSLWPAVATPYNVVEKAAHSQVEGLINDFYSAKDAKALDEIGWARVKRKKLPPRIELYSRMLSFLPSKTSSQSLVSCVVQGSAVEVASHLYYKVIDQSCDLIKKRNDHTFDWYGYYDMPKPFSPRDVTYFGSRKYDPEDDSYVIAYQSYEDPRVPVHTGVVRTQGRGGYTIKSKGKNKCTVTRVQFIDLGINVVSIPINSYIHSTLVQTLVDVQSHFRGKAEGKR